MDSIKNFIFLIQGIAGVCALAKIVYHIFVNLNEDDHTMRNKKIKNILVVLIIIETGISFAFIIKGYYQ